MTAGELAAEFELSWPTMSGHFAVLRDADLIMIDTRRLSYAGAGSDILAALVFTPFPEPVDTVMVTGRLVVEGGELVGVDVPGLVERAEAFSEALLTRGSAVRKGQ